jgi:hypothetical protein
MSFRSIRADGDKAITTEELRQKIPAIFAEHKHYLRSESYVEIPTIDAIEALAQEGFYVVEAMQASPRDVSRVGKCKHVVRLRHPDVHGRERKIGGAAYFEVLLKNAFDGTAAFVFSAGVFRWVCMNGAVVADNMVEAIHVMHMGNRRKLLDRVLFGVKNVVNQAPKVIEAVNSWTQLQLSDTERNQFAERAHVIRFNDLFAPVKSQQLLIPRRQEDLQKDLWTTFNVVQENCIRGGIAAPRADRSGRVINRTTREIRGIDQNMQVNKALWAAASDLAARKLAA